MAIAFDAKKTKTWGGFVNSVNWNHTVGVGSDRLLVVQISNTTGNAISSVTYNGVALTQAIDNSSGGYDVQIWYLTNPASGTYSIVVTFAVAGGYQIGNACSSSYTGADQSSPLDNTSVTSGNSAAPYGSVTTASAGLVISTAVVTSSSPTVSAPAVNLYTANPSNDRLITSSSGSQTVSYTATSGAWYVILAAFKQVSAPPPSTGRASTDAFLLW